MEIWFTDQNFLQQKINYIQIWLLISLKKNELFI